MITGILIAAVLVGGTGLVIGLLLGVAGKKFAVEVNEKEIAVREQLPGNNCGGCGYPGCDGLAAAIAAGKAPVNGCPVGGNEVAKAIAAIMGEEITEGRRMAAFVKCAGDCESSRNNYVYDGVEDCSVMAFIPGYGMRAAGDVKFSMITSCCTMWLCRVSLCIYLCRAWRFGPIAVWIGMAADWSLRSILFTIRFKSGKWLNHHLLEEKAAEK